jgi:hypothetical protein
MPAWRMPSKKTATPATMLMFREALRMNNLPYMVAQALLPVPACAFPNAYVSCLHSQEWLCHSSAHTAGRSQGDRYSFEVSFWASSSPMILSL